MNERKLIRKGDIVVIITVLVVAALLLIPRFTGGKGATAEIYVDGELKHEIILSEIDKETKFTENGTVIVAQNGKIRFENSDCRDKICVNAGWISSPSQTAACIPNKVVIVISGEENPLDAVTY